MGIRLATSAKREAILEGMLEAVGADGYERTSVRTVLDRTGAYRQAFYDNFTGKDDCYLQAYDLGVERVEAQVLAGTEGKHSWQGKLRSGLAALLDLLDAEPDVGRALIVEVHAAGSEALAKRAAAMQHPAAFLDQAREVATAEALKPPPIASENVVAGIHSVIHGRLATGANDGFRQLLPDFIYFATLPYFGPKIASEQMALADRGDG